jgi:hypothetical protein
MLRYVVGDTSFFKGLREYLKIYGGGTARTSDFQKVMEQISGLNLTAFFNEWIYGTGYPSYTINWNYTGGFVHLSSFQKNAKETGNLFSIPPSYRFYYVKGDSMDVRLDGKAIQNEYHKIAVSDSVKKIVFDPENYILNDITLIKNSNLTGIEKLQTETDFVVFPNPAKDKITVSSSNEKFELFLYDLNGRMIQCSKGYDFEKTLISNEKPGLYLLKIHTKNGDCFKKIQIEN